MHTEPKSTTKKTHQPCPSCKSSDALSLYSDGHTHCFSCEETTFPEVEKPAIVVNNQPRFIQDGRYADLKDRGIPAHICQFFDYQTKELQQGTLHIANIFNERGILIAQKLRYPHKQFSIIGSLQSYLIGQHKKNIGSFIILTEGEIDMLTWGYVLGVNERSNYLIVSLPNGAGSAKRVIASNLNYLSKFQQVYLSFDHDEQGNVATQECALLLADHNLRLIQLPLKDANEVFLKKGADYLRGCFKKAQSYRPEKALRVCDVKESALKPIEEGIPWFCKSLTRITLGRQYGSVYLIAGGTGSGKTDFITQQVAFDIKDLNLKVAVFYMEMPSEELCQRVAGKAIKKLLHLPDLKEADLDALKNALNDEQFNNNFYFWDCNGTTPWDELETAVKYYVSENIRLFYIDNLTALATGSDKEERKELERIMPRLSALAKRYSIMILIISHLTAPETGSHEEGAKVTIRQLKGSRTIGFWPNGILGLERNQQAIHENSRNKLSCRILKWRFLGSAVGSLCNYSYNTNNGILYST